MRAFILFARVHDAVVALSMLLPLALFILAWNIVPDPLWDRQIPNTIVPPLFQSIAIVLTTFDAFGQVEWSMGVRFTLYRSLLVLLLLTAALLVFMAGISTWEIRLALLRNMLAFSGLAGFTAVLFGARQCWMVLLPLVLFVYTSGFSREADHLPNTLVAFMFARIDYLPATIVALVLSTGIPILCVFGARPTVTLQE